MASMKTKLKSRKTSSQNSIQVANSSQMRKEEQMRHYENKDVLGIHNMT